MKLIQQRAYRLFIQEKFYGSYSITEFFKDFIENEETAIVEDW